mgnify:FL=1
MMLLFLLSCAPEQPSEVDCWRSIDVDCDGVIQPYDCDDTDPEITVPDRYYPDLDGDGFGVWLGAEGFCEDPGPGWVDCLGVDWHGNECPEQDCDDTDPDIGADC